MKKQSDWNAKKEPLKISCFFKEDGMDLKTIIEQSFRFFIKSELAKQCG